MISPLAAYETARAEAAAATEAVNARYADLHAAVGVLNVAVEPRALTVAFASLTPDQRLAVLAAVAESYAARQFLAAAAAVVGAHDDVSRN